MKKDIENLKKELVVEIKALAADIASSNSYVGLLANEIKFRSLQEKFINLKFLERKQYGLEIFESNVVVEFPEDIALQEVDFTEEPGQEITLKSNSLVQENATPEREEPIHPEEIAPITNLTAQHADDLGNVTKHQALEKAALPDKFVKDIPQKDTEDAVAIAEAEEVQTLIHSPEETDKVDDIKDIEEPTKINEFKDAQGAIEEAEVQKIVFPPLEIDSKDKALPPMQIDFNDQLAFRYQLFDGDGESMDMVIRTLNAIQSLSDSKKYLSDLQEEMQWTNKTEYVERLEELVIKRFE